MDIAAMSVANATASARMGAATSMAKNVMDVAKQQGEELVKMMEQTAVPAAVAGLGENVDVKL